MPDMAQRPQGSGPDVRGRRHPLQQRGGTRAHGKVLVGTAEDRGDRRAGRGQKEGRRRVPRPAPHTDSQAHGCLQRRSGMAVPASDKPTEDKGVAVVQGLARGEGGHRHCASGRPYGVRGIGTAHPQHHGRELGGVRAGERQP